jgi:hypothetical protein
VVIDQVYASFQYPADHRYPYPILFNSGGGHTARVCCLKRVSMAMGTP